MPQFHSSPEPHEPRLQPPCPTCGSPMWLVRLEHPAPADPAQDKLYFECKVCDAKTVLSPEDPA